MSQDVASSTKPMVARIPRQIVTKLLQGISVIGLLASASPLPAHAEDPTFPPEIQKLIFTPEDKIDVGNAALIFAKAMYPNTDIPHYSAMLDALAEKVKKSMGPHPTPEQARAAMSEVIYQKEGYHYDFDPSARTNALDYFLPGTLERKLGTCYTLPLLYMAVAQRAGLPVYPVSAPQHNFLRITTAPLTLQNIEATSGGGIRSDLTYVTSMNISEVAVQKGTYLRTLTHHEFLAHLLANNANYYALSNQPDKAIAYYEEAWSINPHFDSIALGMEMAYAQKSEADMDSYWKSPQTSDGLDRASKDLEKASTWSKTFISMGAHFEDYKDAPTQH